MSKKLSELKPTDEVMIELGAKTGLVGAKVVTLEEKRTAVMTKAAYKEMLVDTDEDGHNSVLGRTVEALGTVEYKTETDAMGNDINVPKAVKFAKEKEEAEAPK